MILWCGVRYGVPSGGNGESGNVVSEPGEQVIGEP
jgi:hypothetical protein